MLVPLSWLGDFVALDAFFGPGGRPGPGEGLRRLTETLDSLGLVVERVDHVGRGLDGVVVARVLEIAPIEGADKIRRVVVDAGGSDPVEVVCGAWNFSTGDLVPLATVGTTLPGGMAIERRKLRGVTSSGMLCSGAELHLAGDAAGILVLERPGEPAPAGPAAPAAATRPEPGMALRDHLGIEADVVLDLAIEPNRPDCLSIAGIARDLAAKVKLPFHLPEPAVATSGTPAGELAAIELRAPSACGRLVARVLTGIAPVASPRAVQRRLVLAGMRPISAVVDASNYAMLELGQPTHAYDLDRLGGSGVAVRLARPGERLVTLDGVERALGAMGPAAGSGAAGAECVVADLTDTVVGLGGVMGGAATEVGAATTRVLLESAAFTSSVVARGARHHGLRSEASVRFERGIDPEGLVRAADRVCELVVEAARAAGVPEPVVAPGVLDERHGAAERRRIVLRTERLNGVLGTALSAGDAAGYLEPIGFGTTPVDGGLEVEVPSFRPDTTLEVDLVEEVARHHGYERIAATERRSPSVGLLSETQAARRRLRRLLTGTGASEAWTSSIVDPSVARRLGASARAIGLANPMVAEESVLRTHLLPGLLDALRRNVARGNEDVRLFELGAVFAARVSEVPVGRASIEALVEEREHLGVLLAGAGDDAASAVACLWRLVEGLGLDQGAVALHPRLAGPGDPVPAVLEEEEGLGADLLAGCHPTRHALVVANGQGEGEGGPGPATVLGAVGEVDPLLLEAFGLDGGRRVGWLAVDLGRLTAAPRRSALARPVSRFPPSDVDLAFLLDRAVPAASLVGVVREAAGAIGEWAGVVDAYRGDAMGPAARSVTVRTRLRALDRTLSDRDVASFRETAIALAGKRLGARLRA